MRFNGFNPSDISPKVFVSHEVIGSIPPRELRTIQTQHGALVAGADLREREIHLFLNFAGRSHANANEMASRVASIFCTDEPKEYEPGHMPGRAFSAILQDASDMEWRWGFGVIEYTFIAPRPYSHSIGETVVNTTGNNIRIEPRGDVAARPVLKHTLAAAAAALTYSIDGTVFFRLRDPSGSNLPAGLVTVIDFANRKVTVNSDTMMTYVDYTVSDWHPLLLGGVNIVCSDAGASEVRWHDEWM